MTDLKGKKLLIVGGAFQHVKLVEAAHKLGVLTYVVDYLPIEKSPAKQISDYHFECNITEIDKIVDYCKENKIDGALSSHLDACQLPYQEICERMGYYCFGNKEQFLKLTDKKVFLNECLKNNVDIIPQYNEDDFIDNKSCDCEFPVFVKPCDSRGSRGQTICHNFDEIIGAIDFAKSESKTGKVVIEKYMGDKQDFSMSYLVVDGEPFLVRTADRYLGNKEDGMDKSAIFGIAPSQNTELFLKKADKKVRNLIKNIGIKNGPVFMQGFIDNDVFRFYDPGLRFPGIEYDQIFEKANGLNLCKALINFALLGFIPNEYKNDNYLLNGNFGANLFIPIKSGIISDIKGLDYVKMHKSIVAFFQKYNIGDFVGDYKNVNQRFCEVDIIAPSINDMKNVVLEIYSNLSIIDENNNDMKISKFNVDLLNV